MRFTIGRKVIKPGAEIKDFRGEAWTFVCALRAASPGKSGKIIVRQKSGGREFYDSVFDGRVSNKPGSAGCR
jgi:hypothetical protein